ncbi:MAG: hypothetical protein VX475_05075, partial [Myxococcota bacterium]|nr:hypothetical protein [Myxococcota bacterium]
FFFVCDWIAHKKDMGKMTITETHSKSSSSTNTTGRKMMTVAQVADFYRKAMTGRGWQESKHSKHLDRFAFEHAEDVEGGKVLQFKRGIQNVTLTIHPSSTGSSVSAILSD